jgi:transposase InsO family protein
MRYQFIAAHRVEFPIRRMCVVLGVSASGYYAWRRRTPSRRAVADAALAVHIRAVFAESQQTYGSPRIHVELVAQGQRCGRHRVARLMRLAHLRARHKRRSRPPTTTRVDAALPVAPNRLERDFTATAPNCKWLCDITYVPTDEGWLYLAVVMDLFSRRIVGWHLDDTLDTSLALTALRMALGRRQPPAGLLHHSDRGCQYASADYQAVLTAHHVVVSMSRTGNCYDNAPMESFFATLKSELIHACHYHTRDEARQSIVAYIEGFYNAKRRHSALGYLSPVEFERQAASAS